ncbi:MAG TPA: IucA/IucC family protein [Micromonosporaceae bacterium]
MSAPTAELGVAAARAAAELADVAPHLVAGYRTALPRAADVVGRRLLGALWREDLADVRTHPPGPGRWHAFDRMEFDRSPAGDPVALLPSSIVDGPGRALAAELTDAVVNLAVAYARREGGAAADTMDGDADPDGRALRAERLAIDGHNLHPCGRTRLGWQVPDLLAHDLEADQTAVAFVAVRRHLAVGDDLGAVLADAYPDLPAPPPGYRLQPVHAWQLDAVLRDRYADLLADGDLRPLATRLPAAPTAALRTLLLPPGVDGHRRYLKLSLDIQVTSTRRTISVASTRNGPALSSLLPGLVARHPEGARVLVLPEYAGAAVPVGPGRDRDMAAIVRAGLAGRLEPGEVAVPGGALPAVDPRIGCTVIAGLVDRYATERGRADRAGAALDFVEEYARLVLPPVLGLAARYGVGLEAHLQNCLPTFRGGVPHRLVLRDFAGLRLHRQRLAAAGVRLVLWPNSVVATDDADVLRAKVGYTALQAHIGEIVVRLTESHGLDEPAAWRRVRAVVDEAYAGLAAEPAVAAAAAEDHAALTAPRVPHKALVRMRLVGAGDIYWPVDNPLHDGRC